MDLASTHGLAVGVSNLERGAANLGCGDGVSAIVGGVDGEFHADAAARADIRHVAECQGRCPTGERDGDGLRARRAVSTDQQRVDVNRARLGRRALLGDLGRTSRPAGIVDARTVIAFTTGGGGVV